MHLTKEKGEKKGGRRGGMEDEVVGESERLWRNTGQECLVG